MSRFYKGAKPAYVDDFLYQPPWELIERVMNKKQTEFTGTLQNMEMLSGKLNVGYIPDSVEEANLNRIKDHYQGRVDEYTQKLSQDPDSYEKLMPELMNLGREINKDLTSGDLSKIQGSYNAYQSWIKDPEIAKMKQQDPGRYQRALSSNMSKWAVRENRSLDGQFSGSGIYDPKDFSTGLEKIIKELEPDLQKQGVTNVGGQWVSHNTAEEKGVTMQRIQSMILNKIQSDPTLIDYMKQQEELGYQGYVKDGQLVPLVLEDGSINPASALAPAVNFGNSFAYNQTTSDNEVKVNDITQKALDRQHESSMQERGFAHAFDIETHKAKLKAEYGSDSEGGSGTKGTMTENLGLPEGIFDKLLYLDNEKTRKSQDAEETFKASVRPIYDALTGKLPNGEIIRADVNAAGIKQMLSKALSTGAISQGEFTRYNNMVTVADQKKRSEIISTGSSALAGAIVNTSGGKISPNQAIKYANATIKGYSERIKDPATLSREVVRVRVVGQDGKPITKEFTVSELSGTTHRVMMKDASGKYVAKPVTFPKLLDPLGKPNSDFFVAESVNPVVPSSNASEVYIQASVRNTGTITKKGQAAEGAGEAIPIIFKNKLEPIKY